MIVVTTDTLPGYQITRVIGIVTVSIDDFLTSPAADQCFAALGEKATRYQANAVVGARIVESSGDLAMAYGTAVEVQPRDHEDDGYEGSGLFVE